jgi:hypothetical protein
MALAATLALALLAAWFVGDVLVLRRVKRLAITANKHRLRHAGGAQRHRLRQRGNQRAGAGAGRHGRGPAGQGSCST